MERSRCPKGLVCRTDAPETAALSLVVMSYPRTYAPSRMGRRLNRVGAPSAGRAVMGRTGGRENPIPNDGLLSVT
jgi:hypothetical protein